MYAEPLGLRGAQVGNLCLRVMTQARIEPDIFRIQIYTITTTPTFLRVASAQGIDLDSQAVSGNPTDKLSVDCTLTPSNSCRLCKSLIFIDDVSNSVQLFLSTFNFAAQKINLRQFKVLDFVLGKYLHDYTSINLGMEL